MNKFVHAHYHVISPFYDLSGSIAMKLAVQSHSLDPATQFTDANFQSLVTCVLECVARIGRLTFIRVCAAITFVVRVIPIVVVCVRPYIYIMQLFCKPRDGLVASESINYFEENNIRRFSVIDGVCTFQILFTNEIGTPFLS